MGLTPQNPVLQYEQIILSLLSWPLEEDFQGQVFETSEVFLVPAAGGARKGAGRKPTAAKYVKEVNAVEKLIAKNLPKYIGNLESLADGILVQETDKNGRDCVYSRAPDRQANEYLINRVAGKPTEHVEQDNTGLLTVKVEYVNNNAST